MCRTARVLPIYELYAVYVERSVVFGCRVAIIEAKKPRSEPKIERDSYTARIESGLNSLVSEKKLSLKSIKDLSDLGLGCSK